MNARGLAAPRPAPRWSGATTRNGAGAVRAGVRDQRQGLQRLAEPHVVGEDPAEPGLPQEGQPAEAVELVGPQLGLDADRVDRGQRVQRRGAPAPRGPTGRPARRRCRPRRARPTGPGRGGRPGRRRRAGRCSSAAASTSSAQVGELGAVDAQVHAVAQDHPVDARGQRLEHVGQRDRGAVDGDLHLEVEPVGAGRASSPASLAGGEVDRPGRRRSPGSRGWSPISSISTWPAQPGQQLARRTAIACASRNVLPSSSPRSRWCPRHRW